jgi:hypothetical protein
MFKKSFDSKQKQKTKNKSKKYKMNNLKIFLISVLLVSSSNAFLMGTISNIISSGISTINGAILGGQFIWYFIFTNR